MEAIIQLRQVSRVYRQGEQVTRALDRIDLEIQRGDFAALCGPSGSGKTTCLNLIGALDKADEGQVILDGHDLMSLAPGPLARLRRDRIGFVFQAYNLIPVLTAYENVEFILALQKRPLAERREIGLGLLKQVGLEGLENRRPDELSGGQQQRVAIARAMAHEPAVVLADEPTANLDSRNAEALLDLMKRLNAERGLTFVFSTHDPRVMSRAKRVIQLRDGRVESDQSA